MMVSHHFSKFMIQHHFESLHAKFRRQYAVVGDRNAATLQVAENGFAHVVLEACCFQLIDKGVADASEFLVFVSYFFTYFIYLLAVFWTSAFRCHDDGETAIEVEALFKAFLDNIDVVWKFRQQT